MKKTLLIIVLAIIAITSKAEVALTPYVDATFGGLNENNINAAENRLRTLISSNGMVSDCGGRFVLACKVNLLDRSITATAPARIVQNVQITLAIGDGITGDCFGSCTFESQGVGQTEEQALLFSLKNIKTNDPGFKALVKKASDRITQYYEQNGPAIIANAKSLLAGQKYDEALYMLSTIPSGCSSFKSASEMMAKVYQANINHDADQILVEAKALWSADPSPENAEAVMAILSQINTGSKAYSQAQALMKQVETRVKNVTEQERKDRLAAEKADRDLERYRIQQENARYQASKVYVTKYITKKVQSNPAQYKPKTKGWY